MKNLIEEAILQETIIQIINNKVIKFINSEKNKDILIWYNDMISDYYWNTALKKCEEEYLSGETDDDICADCAKEEYTNECADMQYEVEYDEFEKNSGNELVLSGTVFCSNPYKKIGNVIYNFKTKKIDIKLYKNSDVICRKNLNDNKIIIEAKIYFKNYEDLIPLKYFI